MSEPSEEESNLWSVVESGRTARTPSDPRHIQAASDLHCVNVCAHQHSVIAGSPSSINRRPNLLRDPVCFVRSGAESPKSNGGRTPWIRLGAQILGDPESRLKAVRIVESNQATRSGQDGRGAAVVLGEHHLPCVWIAIHESENVADRRTSESIDGLIVITNCCEVATPLRDQVDECPLETIRILVLINKEPAMPLAHACRNEWVAAENLVGEEHLIAEVEQPTLCEDPPIGAVDGGELPLLFAKACQRRRILFKLLPILRWCLRIESNSGSLRAKLGCEGFNCIGTDRLLLCTRDVARNVAKESCWVAERRKS